MDKKKYLTMEEANQRIAEELDPSSKAVDRKAVLPMLKVAAGMNPDNSQQGQNG